MRRCSCLNREYTIYISILLGLVVLHFWRKHVMIPPKLRGLFPSDTYLILDEMHLEH